MKKFIWTLPLALALCLVASGTASAEGRAALAIYPSEGTLVPPDASNPWLDDGWVTTSSDFDLFVKNTKDDPIYFTRLVMAIPSDMNHDGWSFKLGGIDYDYTAFTHDTLHPILNSHGIFGNGTRWTEVGLGTLDGGQVVGRAFLGSGIGEGMYVHFDAYGSSSSTTQDGRFFAPYSHDVTVTPEPISVLLYGIGGIPLAGHFLRRRKVAA